MERKKLLRSGVAILCIVSMVFGYFVGLAPAAKAEAAETTETLPTDFTEVTPREFGIADFSGNTAQTLYKSLLKPIDSPNKVMLRTNVVFGAENSKIHILDSSGTGETAKGFYLVRNASGIRLVNSYTNASFYIGGQVVDGTYQGEQYSGTQWYWQMYPLADANSYDTTEIELTITMEMVTFNTSGTDNDLKVGIWFDGVLYNNTYAYFRDFTINANNIYMDMNVKSASSPLVTAQSEWDGYRVVTPATFGIPDYVESATGVTTSTTAQGVDVVPYNIDKTMFQADVVFKQNETSKITYLYNSAGEGQLVVQVSVGSNSLRVKNEKQNGDTQLYIGGKFEDGEYIQGTYAPVAKGGEQSVYYTSNSAIGGAPHNKTKYKLWITTEFVEFDGDGEKNDLQIGVWFNGALLIADTYFYYVDYEETTQQGMLATDNVYTIISPMVEPDDLGLIGGEYAATDSEFFASTVATSKVMNGTTLHTDVFFNGVGASLYYGCDATDNTKAFKFTSTAEGIQVSHTYGDAEEPIVLLNQSNVGVDVVNNKFDLKLSTDVVDSDGDTEVDDIKLGIQVNSKACGYFIPNVASQLTGRIGVECTGDTTVILGRFASETEDEIYHCLDDGTYTRESAEGISISRLSLNGDIIADGNLTLDTLGTYRVVVTENRQVYRENVTVYKRYDVNENKTVEITDLVRMLKVANDSTLAEQLGRVGQLAIGYESAETWSQDIAVPVLEFMRKELVGAEATEGKTGDITLINKEELQKFANKHGAFTANFTFTADLASDSINRTEQVWILSTNAKYISVNGNYPTVQYKLMKANGSQLYISQPYMIGEKNTYVEREWRVPETLEDYTTLQVKFVIPDGVALYIDEISDKDNVVGDLSSEDETVYNGDDGVKYLAHSGFIGYAPDNTLLGFEMAGKMGFKSLITIPKFTSDGVGVCFHDDNYIRDRLEYDDGTEITETDANYSKKIEDFTYEELQQFDAGIRKGEAFASDVPTLEQYFDICFTYKMAPIFSVHPELTTEQWTYVKNLLQQDKYKVGDNYWLYDNFQIKAGSTSGLQVPFEVFGFDIGGYIIIQAATFGTADLIYVMNNSGLVKEAQEQNINLFDKVSVEVFNYADDVEEKIAYYKAYGFQRISLAPKYGLDGGFSGAQLRHYMDLGVNSFTVDYHCSMGLNW